jgi:phosphopentomutase
MPDAATYHDAGTNTIAHVAEVVPSLHVPHLVELGLHRIVSGLSVNGGLSPAGAYGRLRSENKAKDTICGHWEIAGIIQDPRFAPIH